MLCWRRKEIEIETGGVSKRGNAKTICRNHYELKSYGDAVECGAISSEVTENQYLQQFTEPNRVNKMEAYRRRYPQPNSTTDIRYMW